MYQSFDSAFGIRRHLDRALLYIESIADRDPRYIFDGPRFEAELKEWSIEMRSLRDRCLDLERLVSEYQGRVTTQEAQIRHLKAMLEIAPQNSS